mmetsp:Transcript_24066/g.42490  ORF Transcript_24066/g.42490 Transcript_24066/m.42490 type:complete len:540 (-) Transcript_24066:100-1719(-)
MAGRADGVEDVEGHSGAHSGAHSAVHGGPDGAERDGPWQAADGTWMQRKRAKVNKRRAEDGPLPGRCQQLVLAKDRYCTRPALGGGTLCEVHCDESSKYGKRVPCPVDPSHTVYESRLKRHMKRCNVIKIKSKVESQPYFSKDLHAGTLGKEDTNSSTGNGLKRLFDVSVSAQDSLIARLDDLLKQAGAIGGEDDFSEFLEVASYEELQPASTGMSKSVKHKTQEAAILENIVKVVSPSETHLPEGSCLVEMGAGRGGLSLTISDTTPKDRKIYFITVDRAAAKNHKSALIRTNENRFVENVRADIKHLDLGKVPLMKQVATDFPDASTLIVSKHLCGVATCLSLRCALHVVESGLKPPGAFVIALCCHHLCNYDDYIYPKLIQSLGLERQEFDIIRRMSSWATCAFDSPWAKSKRAADLKAEKVEKAEKASAETPVSTDNEMKNDVTLQTDTDAATGTATGATSEPDHAPSKDIPKNDELSDNEKTLVGRKCKLLLNYGRLLYLREKGYTANLVKFAPLATTLENVLLVAHPKEDTST